MTPAADLFRALPLGGKGLALLASVSVHAAVAWAAVQGAPHSARNASLTTDPVVELDALELAPAESPSPAAPSPASTLAHARARHHHDYPVPPEHDARPHDPTTRHVLPVPSALNAAPAAEPAAPTVLEAPAPPAARFVMTVAPVVGAMSGSSAVRGSAEAAGESAAAEPASEASVDLPAKLLAGSSPSYTHEAEAAGVEADVPLEIVVDGSGSVISARALSRVGYGLEDAALRSVRGYRFSPARRSGMALAVRMRWLMRFQLR